MMYKQLESFSCKISQQLFGLWSGGCKFFDFKNVGSTRTSLHFFASFQNVLLYIQMSPPKA